jgi:hypothetical protein
MRGGRHQKLFDAQTGENCFFGFCSLRRVPVRGQSVFFGATTASVLWWLVVLLAISHPNTLIHKRDTGSSRAHRTILVLSSHKKKLARKFIVEGVIYIFIGKNLSIICFGGVLSHEQEVI